MRSRQRIWRRRFSIGREGRLELQGCHIDAPIAHNTSYLPVASTTVAVLWILVGLITRTNKEMGQCDPRKVFHVPI